MRDLSVNIEIFRSVTHQFVYSQFWATFTMGGKVCVPSNLVQVVYRILICAIFPF